MDEAELGRAVDRAWFERFKRVATLLPACVVLAGYAIVFAAHATQYWSKEDEARYFACVSKWPSFIGEWQAAFGPASNVLLGQPKPAPRLFARLLVRERDTTLYLRLSPNDDWQEINTSSRSFHVNSAIDQTQVFISEVSANPRFPEAHSFLLLRNRNSREVSALYSLTPAATFGKQNTTIHFIETRHGRASRILLPGEIDLDAKTEECH